MESQIIEIRGNISHAIARYEVMAKEREEREKAERAARFERERLEREERSKEWKKKHAVLDKYTYISEWNYATYSWQGNYCKIYFYEWSDIYCEPRFFAYDIPFFRFLDDSGIMPTDADVNTFRTFSGCHIVCKPGCKELIVGKDYAEMKQKFEEVKLLANVLASVPDTMDS